MRRASLACGSPNRRVAAVEAAQRVFSGEHRPGFRNLRPRRSRTPGSSICVTSLADFRRCAEMAAEDDLPAGGAREAGSDVAAAEPRLRFQIAQLRVDQADVAIIGPATLGAGIVAADGDAPGSLVLVETAQIMRGVVYVRRGVQNALGLVAAADRKSTRLNS